MAKPSSIPRKNFRTNYSQKIPSSPLRPHTSTLPPRDLVAKDHQSVPTENREQGEEDDDDDFNPFTSHKASKFLAPTPLPHQKSQHQEPHVDSSLWLFDQDGQADSTNIMQGVMAPWGMLTSDGEDDAPTGSENPIKKKTSATIKSSFTGRLLSSSKIRVHSPVNDLASTILSPTHKLTRRNPPAHTSPTRSSSIFQRNQLAKPDAVISSLKKVDREDCSPPSTTSELQHPCDAPRSQSVQPTEVVSEKPMPPSAIKKPRDPSVDPPKSVKKTRFIDLDGSVNRYPSSSSGQVPPIAAPSAISGTAPDDTSHHTQALTGERGKLPGVTVSEKTLGTLDLITNVSAIPNSTSHPTTSMQSNTSYPIQESPKRQPAVEVISLLSSPSIQPLSPDRTLASRLQPSHSKKRSSRASSVESSTNQATINNPNQRAKAQNAPLSSFKRLSRTNSANSKVFQTIQTAPVATLNRSSSMPNSDLLRPSRMITDLASLTGVPENDAPAGQASINLTKPSKRMSKSSGGIIEVQTPITAQNSANTATNKEQASVEVTDENDCYSQSAVPPEQPESFKRQKVSNNSEGNSSLSGNEGIQEVRSKGVQQDSSRNFKVRGQKPTNRVHVSEKVGPRLSALLELPTPNSTVDAIGSGDIEEIIVGSNLSMVCQNDGVPQFSTPHSAGPVSLPLPPDTHQLPTSRPRRSSRKSSVRPSPLNPSALSSNREPQSSPLYPITQPIRSLSKKNSNDSAIPSLPTNPDLASLPSANDVDAPEIILVKPASHSSTQAPLALSLDSSNSTNTTSSIRAPDKQDAGTVPTRLSKDAIHSIDNDTGCNGLKSNEANLPLSKKRSRVQTQTSASLRVKKATVKESRQESSSTEPTVNSIPLKQAPAKTEQAQTASSTQQTENELKPADLPVTSTAPSIVEPRPLSPVQAEVSEVARGKRPSTSNDDEATETVSKRPRVPSTSTTDNPQDPQVPNNLLRVRRSQTRSSSFPHKPTVPQSRTRVTSQTVREVSLSRVHASTHQPEQKKASDNLPKTDVNSKTMALQPKKSAPPNPQPPPSKNAPLLQKSSKEVEKPVSKKSSDNLDRPEPANVQSATLQSNQPTFNNRKPPSPKATSLSQNSPTEAEKPKPTKGSDNAGNSTTDANSRAANGPNVKNPQPPSSESMSLSHNSQKEADKFPTSTVSAHVKSTDVPAASRFTICLGVPSHPPSDLLVAHLGTSELVDAQPTIPSNEGSIQQPIPTSNTHKTQRATSHSLGDKDNLQSRNAATVSQSNAPVKDISQSRSTGPGSRPEAPIKKTSQSRSAGPSSHSEAPIKNTSQSRSTGPASHSEAPILTLPKEFAFTMRSTIPAKPRIKDVRQQTRSDHQTVGPKPTDRRSEKVSVTDPPNSKQLARVRSNDCDDDRASKRPRNNRSTVASPSRFKVGCSRPGLSNRVRNTVKRLNGLSKNALTATTTKRIPASGTSSQLSRQPPPAITSSTRFMSSSGRQTSDNLQSTSKNAPAISQNGTMTTKNTRRVVSNSSQSDQIVINGMPISAERQLLMEEIRQRSKAQNSQMQAAPTSSQSALGASSNKRSNKSAYQPLVDITQNPSRPVRGTSRVVSGASSSRTTSTNLTNETRMKNQTDTNALKTSIGFQNRLNKWREVEVQQSLNSSTQSHTNKLPEWQDVSLVHHVLPVKDFSKPKKPPMKFGLATERRVFERENWEQIKANKEKIEAQIKAQEEMKAKELEREEFIKMRKECIIKANPVPEYLKKHR